MKLANIMDQTRTNHNFRKVVATGAHAQVVLMSLKAGEEIGEEVHKVDQILYFVEGAAKSIIDGIEEEIIPGDLVLVKAGQKHNFINTGSGELKLYTVYAPPQHRDGTIHKTKADAEADEADEYKG